MSHRPSLPAMPIVRAAEAIIIATGRCDNEPVMFCTECADPIPKASSIHESVGKTPETDINVECPHCGSTFVARAELRFSTRRSGLPRKPRDRS